jgi:osmotically-inducible protein OsmY
VDHRLARRVVQAIARALGPRACGVSVGVTVSGVVWLTGDVGSHGERHEAVAAAESVLAVRVVADDLTLAGHQTDDTLSVLPLAERIHAALRRDPAVPLTVSVDVRPEGFAVLRGEVERREEGMEAERAVKAVVGGAAIVTNLVTVTEVDPQEVERLVADALRRMAVVDGGSINATVSDESVRLRGVVHAHYEKEVAETAALLTPGVSDVQNDIVVIP